MSLTRRVHLSFVFVLAGLFLISGLAEAERPEIPAQIEMAVKGRDLILQRKYEDAEAYLKGLVNRWPDELLGYFGLMALYQIRNLDNYDFRFDADFRPWEDKGRPLALKIAKDPGSSAWDMLLAGGTLGISGFYRAHNTKWFAAMRDTSLGFHTAEKAYQKDKTLTEALLGVGLYDYWRSYFTRKLLFLPFFADRREQGKDELHQARDGSQFASVLADISLLFIDFQEKKYDQVAVSIDRLLAAYPKNTSLRFLRGETLLRQKKYDQVVSEFEKILEIDPSIHKAYLYIGIALADEKKDTEKSKSSLRKFLELEPKASEEWRKPALEKLNSLERN